MVSDVPVRPDPGLSSRHFGLNGAARNVSLRALIGNCGSCPRWNVGWGAGTTRRRCRVARPTGLRRRMVKFAKWPICGLGGETPACNHRLMGGRLRVDRICRRTGRVVTDDGVVVVARCHVADRPLARLIGLLGTPALADGEGVWIAPCHSVHMFGMRQSIACLFVDRDGVVCDMRLRLDPGTHATARGAWAAIEARPGSFDGVRVGDRLRLVVDMSPTDR